MLDPLVLHCTIARRDVHLVTWRHEALLQVVIATDLAEFLRVKKCLGNEVMPYIEPLFL